MHNEEIPQQEGKESENAVFGDLSEAEKGTGRLESEINFNQLGVEDLRLAAEIANADKDVKPESLYQELLELGERAKTKPAEDANYKRFVEWAVKRGGQLLLNRGFYVKKRK